MLCVPGPHDAGVVVDDDEVGVVGQPADRKYCYDYTKHLDNLKQQVMLKKVFPLYYEEHLILRF